jgi:glycogen operon protein
MAQRKQQAKNAIAILLLSQGVPMLLAGDEVLNTQNGNNNGYCQDNELTWFDWRLLQTNADMLRFVQHMIALRKRHPCLMRRRFLTGSPVKGRDIPDVSWHGIDIDAPLWNDPDVQVLAFTLAAVADGEADIHVMLNLSGTAIEMELPAIQGRELCLTLDTGLAAPDDMVSPEDQRSFSEKRYPVGARAVVVFEAIVA